MYSRIVVPLDGSEMSESVLPYARALVKTLKIPVELLHAIDPDVVSLFTSPTRGRYLNAVGAEMERDALEYLEPIAGAFPEPMTVSCSVKIGKPSETIVEWGSRDRNILIAMATHGRTEVQRWLLGSVAHHVLLTTINPLLLVRPAENLENTGVATLRKILIPLDGSSLAEKILPHAQALAGSMDLEIVLLRAYDLPAASYYESDAYVPDWAELTRAVRENTQEYLNQLQQRLQAEGLRRVSTLSIQGDAAPNIIEVAKRTPGSLVAMCTHGRSGIGRLVLGSVADRVVRHSGGPVLVIRPQPKKT
jgi:nucleotide-binding universal stress UspA family protein